MLKKAQLFIEGNCMKFLNILVILSALATNIAWAGPSVGGGGDVVILPDDSVVLADPFLDGGAVQPNNMPPVRSLNPRILQLINLYRSASEKILKDYGQDINQVMTELGTRKNNLRFYAVQNAQELNLFCAAGGRKIYQLPTGALAQQVACTAGEETFLVEPLFLRLSLRDQSMLLVHERLTTLRDSNGGKNYSAVARFTSGLNSYLNIYAEQAKKKYRILTGDEQKSITEFYIATEELEKRNSEVTEDSFQWIAHANGGGRIKSNASVDESAFVSVSSVVHSHVSIGANSNILNSSIYNSSVGINSKITNLLYRPYVKLTIEDNVLISDVEIKSASVQSLTVKSGVTLKNALIELSSDLVIAENQKLIDGSITKVTQDDYYPSGFVPVPSLKEISIPDFDYSARYSEYNEVSGKNLKKEFFNPAGNGIVITADYKRRDLIGAKIKNDFKNMKVQIVNQYKTRNEDPTKFLINNKGEIIKADYLKGETVTICLNYNFFEQLGKYIPLSSIGYDNANCKIIHLN